MHDLHYNLRFNFWVLWHFLRPVLKSMIVKQRCPFAIRVDNISFTTYSTLTKKARNTDKDRQDDQTAHDYKSEDPLESEDTFCHLCKGKG
jgi:hypothetical protein